MDKKRLLQVGVWALLAVLLLLIFTMSASTAPAHPTWQAPATRTTGSIAMAPQQIVPRLWLPMVGRGDPAVGREEPAPTGSDVLLVIDDDSLDNGSRLNASGGPIIPGGPNFFTPQDVNDDLSADGQRAVLRYFVANVGRTITVMTGETGDEGWFAPTCMPQRWLSGSSNACIDPASPDFKTAIDRFWAGAVQQNALDKTPHVMSLRALGLNALVGKNVCAVVYDSDVSINYDHDEPSLGINGNLEGATLGVVAFRVDATSTLNGFSSGTLPQVRLTISDPSACNQWQLFNAPAPESSSVPYDRTAPGSPAGYRRLMQWPALPQFFPQ
jgi:hypothetical protein